MSRFPPSGESEDRTTVLTTAPPPGEGLHIEDLQVGQQVVPYQEAWQLQRQLHADVASGARPNTLLLLEHPATFTAGSRTEPADRPLSNTPVIDVDRGGRITWHGPGQLVGYPIVRLPHPLDVVAHVRTLEDLIMATCAAVGLTTQRIAGRSGVWVSDPETSESRRDNALLPVTGSTRREPGSALHKQRKVAAIGVRVSRGVTMHGFAINCDCDLSWAQQIVPCGITDAGVTSLTAELGQTITTRTVADIVKGKAQDLWQ